MGRKAGVGAAHYRCAVDRLQLVQEATVGTGSVSVCAVKAELAVECVRVQR